MSISRSDLRKMFTDRRTDGQTDDGRRAIVRLAHRNKLTKFHELKLTHFPVSKNCHNKILMGRLAGIAPTSFWLWSDRPHRPHGVDAYSSSLVAQRAVTR